MDERKNLILIKGENKTWQIRSCYYNKQTKKVDVTFDTGNTYAYNYSSVHWIKNPEVRNPALYRIALDGKVLRGICAIYVFKSHSQWWHLVFENGRGRTYHESKLQIEKSCLDNKKAHDKLCYLSDIAGINELKNEDGEVLLKKQYEKLGFVGEESALANYLQPGRYPVKKVQPSFLIFPFGGNASQFNAVKNALENQLSVIQGPPGTGKTQTILNIIANLLVRGKTVQVVSNNNSATRNVLEKLSLPKLGLDFLVATLGNRENKEAFVKGQSGQYPDISDWERPPDRILELKQIVAKLSDEVSLCFVKQERLAIAKQERDALQVEKRHFAGFCKDIKMTAPIKAPKHGTKSSIILRVMQEIEQCMEGEQSIPLWHKVKSSFLYGIYEWKFHEQKPDNILTYLQSLFYKTRCDELTSEIHTIQQFLGTMNAGVKMEQLTTRSMEYLKAVLFHRYGKKSMRPQFDMDAIWKQPMDVLQEYPVVLSTTFSSRSCLKNAIYDYVIMDEASQVDVATGALALAGARNAVIVGDLKQLPNVITEDVRKRCDAVFQSYQLPQGYHYADNSFLKSVCSVILNVPQTLLREHYRCHPKIIGFCNQKFYQNQLIVMTEDHNEPDSLSVFKTVVGNHQRGRVNQRQIDVTVNEVLPKLTDTALGDIGIIAPYRAQVEEFVPAIKDKGIEVDTVHKFQGREKDTIIITTVDNVVTEFSDDPFLLNVAISRAKKKLCVVTSGNEQPADSNIGDLVKYIEYHNYTVTESQIYSVFDMLYQQYTKQRLAYLSKYKSVSQYDSENLMYVAICKLLQEMPEKSLTVICHQKLRMLIRDFANLTAEEVRYVSHPNTHVDFLIYSRITKEPILAIEIDGFHYHKEGTQQAERDRMKEAVFAKYEIPLLRLPTNGSGEIQKIRDRLSS